MILLDKNAVEQAVSVIPAAAHPYSIFFKASKARCGLPGIHNTDREAFNGLGIPPGKGCNSGESLQEIEGDPLSCEEGPCLPTDTDDLIPAFERVTIPGERLK